MFLAPLAREFEVNGVPPRPGMREKVEQAEAELKAASQQGAAAGQGKAAETSEAGEQAEAAEQQAGAVSEPADQEVVAGEAAPLESADGASAAVKASQQV